METSKLSQLRPICILGMHRSGTSCLTGTLESHGLHLGEVNTFAKFNQKGNRESQEVMRINNDLLALNGGAWDLPPTELVWDDALRERRDGFIRSYAGNRRWGFKDPRCVFTLPFWREALPGMVIVGTFRHPYAVARSLLSRGEKLEPKTPPLLLWKQHNAKILQYHEAFGFPLVCFDWPAAKYAKAVTYIADSLGLVPAQSERVEFYDPNLRHADIDPAEAGIAEPELAEMYESLSRRSLKL